MAATNDEELSERFVWIPLVPILAGSTNDVLKLIRRMELIAGPVLAFDLRNPAINKVFCRALVMFADVEAAQLLRRQGLPRGEEAAGTPAIMRVEPVDTAAGYIPPPMRQLDRMLRNNSLLESVKVRVCRLDGTSLLQGSDCCNSLVFLQPGQQTTWSIELRHAVSRSTDIANIVVTPNLQDLKDSFPFQLKKAGFLMSGGKQRGPKQWIRRFELTVVMPAESVADKYNCKIFFIAKNGQHLSLMFSAHPSGHSALVPQLDRLGPALSQRQPKKIFLPPRASRAGEAACITPRSWFLLRPSALKSIDDSHLAGVCCSCCGSLSDSAGFKENLHTLLWLEEAQNNSFCKLSSISVSFELVKHAKSATDLKGPFAKVNLPPPGAAEDYPLDVEALQPDAVVRLWIEASNEVFEGHVLESGDNSLVVHFNTRLFRGLASSRLKADLQVKFHRYFYGAQHQAIDEIDSRWLCLDSEMHYPALCNSQVAEDVDESCTDVSHPLNDTQRAFLVAVLQQRVPSFTPVLLRGASSTGKTSTLEVLVRKLVLLRPTSVRVLVCTPSRAAAESYVERFGQWCRSLLSFKSMECALSAVLQESVVVSTCQMASALVGIGVPVGHFTHIIVDDASQTFESVVLIPLQLASNTTLVVLAGDEERQGLRCRSQQARRHGFERSIIDRLLRSPRFEPREDGDLLVDFELTTVYNTHPDIVEIASSLFYDDKLVASASSSTPLEHCQLLSRDGKFSPLLFWHVKGGSIETSSPSNHSDEVQVIGQVVSELCTDGRTNIKHSDIAVISPFHSQQVLLRAHLSTLGFQDVHVGALSSKVVIFLAVPGMSTAANDILSNPKLLSVAISCARQALVVVGDATSLATYPHMSQMIQYFDAIHSYHGPALHKLPAVHLVDDHAGHQQDKTCQLASLLLQPRATASSPPPRTPSPIQRCSPLRSPNSSENEPLQVLAQSTPDSPFSALAPRRLSARSTHSANSFPFFASPVAALISPREPLGLEAEQPEVLPAYNPYSSRFTPAALGLQFPYPSYGFLPAEMSSFSATPPRSDSPDFFDLTLLSSVPANTSIDDDWAPLVKSNQGVVVHYRGAVVNSVVLRRAGTERFELLVYYLGRSCVAKQVLQDVEIRFDSSYDFAMSTMASLRLLFNQRLQVSVNLSDNDYACFIIE